MDFNSINFIFVLVCESHFSFKCAVANSCTSSFTMGEQGHATTQHNTIVSKSSEPFKRRVQRNQNYRLKNSD